jgi:hypothetical protein
VNTSKPGWYEDYSVTMAIELSCPARFNPTKKKWI